MAKDKKDKKKKGKKSEKKAAPDVTGTLKTLAQNPIVADVVAAALVATAAALKDSKRARALASDVGDELSDMSKTGAKRGEALWDMALDIGRKSLEAMLAETAAKKSSAGKK